MSTPEPAKTITAPTDRPARFVETVMAKCQKDKGYAAKLKRSDNPATEYQSWEILASFSVDIEKEYQRLPYTTIAAAIAKSKSKINGVLPMGQAIAGCYEEGNSSDQAKAKLRRVLACHDLVEVCRILRPLFSLINSRSKQPLNYIKILKQLLNFYWNEQSVKAQWAQEFYRGNITRKEES